MECWQYIRPLKQLHHSINPTVVFWGGGCFSTNQMHWMLISCHFTETWTLILHRKLVRAGDVKTPILFWVLAVQSKCSTLSFYFTLVFGSDSLAWWQRNVLRLSPPLGLEPWTLACCCRFTSLSAIHSMPFWAQRRRLPSAAAMTSASSHSCNRMSV